MFFILLIVTFLLAAAIAYAVAKLFDKQIAAILRQIIQDEISSAWHRYITFAAFVVGVSGGVRINQLEQYISAIQKSSS